MCTAAERERIFLTPGFFHVPVPSLVASWSAYIISPDVMAFTLACTDISEGIRNKAGRSFRRTFPPGRLLCCPSRPAGYDSVMDYHTAISSPAHLVCSSCYTGIIYLKEHVTNVLSTPLRHRGSVSDGAESLQTLTAVQTVTRYTKSHKKWFQ